MTRPILVSLVWQLVVLSLGCAPPTDSDRGEAQAAFLVRPTTVDQVAAGAERGETMPQKSTFVYPKLTSGRRLYPR